MLPSLVGDPEDYSKPLQLNKKDDLGGKTPKSLAFGKSQDQVKAVVWMMAEMALVLQTMT